MGIVKGLFYLLLLVVLATFFAMNSNSSVDIHLFGQDYLDVQLVWVLLVTFLIGFLTCFVMAAVRELRINGQMRGLKRTLQTREKEIVELRTLPLQDYRPAAAPEGRDG
ncbi:MAG: LapA family protein [Candidatus Krumholzibacteriia bacterium]